MESLLPPLFPRPLDPAELPEPREWTCEHCGQPMNVWDWGNQSVDLTARAITLPPRICSACLIDRADRGFPAFLVEYMQRWHHQMWFRVGEPPGTLIAWQVELHDRTGRTNSDGSPVAYGACIYAILVDLWNDAWPQITYPWGDAPDAPRLVVLGARVVAKPNIRGRHAKGSWIFRWLWPNPAWPEACLLDPPDVPLTDDEAVRMNRARGAFNAFAAQQGRPEGSGRFETGEDFKSAVIHAVAALDKQKRKITQEAVGRILIAKRGRNRAANDSPADPGRQFRAWCTHFELDPRQLISDAMAVGDNGE